MPWASAALTFSTPEGSLPNRVEVKMPEIAVHQGQGLRTMRARF